MFELWNKGFDLVRAEEVPFKASLVCFSGDNSFFMVIFSVEVDNGFLVTSLPAELINTTEIRTMNSYRWQPLQTYVTISQHFTVKANGIRFRGTVNDCNNVMKQLFYYVSLFCSRLHDKLGQLLYY